MEATALRVGLWLDVVSLDLRHGSTGRKAAIACVVALTLATWLVAYYYIEYGAEWEALVGTLVTDAMYTVVAAVFLLRSRALTVACGFDGSVREVPATQQTVPSKTPPSGATGAAGNSEEKPAAAARAVGGDSGRDSELVTPPASLATGSDAAAARSRAGLGPRTPLLIGPAGAQLPDTEDRPYNLADPRATLPDFTVRSHRSMMFMVSFAVVVCVACGSAIDAATAPWHEMDSGGLLLKAVYYVGCVTELMCYYSVMPYVAACGAVLAHRVNCLLRDVRAAHMSAASGPRYGLVLPDTGAGAAVDGVGGPAAAHESDPRVLMRRYMALWANTQEVSKSLGAAPTMLLALGVIEAASLIASVFSERTLKELPPGVAVNALGLFTTSVVSISLMSQMCGVLSHRAEMVGAEASRQYTRLVAAAAEQDGAATDSKLEPDAARHWRVLGEMAIRHPIAVESLGLRYTRELGTALTGAMLTIALGIVGVKIPEMG